MEFKRPALFAGACLVVALLASCGGGSRGTDLVAPALIATPAAAHSATALASRAPVTSAFDRRTTWIWNATDTLDEWVALRKTVTLAAKPDAATTMISADTHYWLWINGALVVFEGGVKRGPNPRDTYYDQLDLAPYLKKGANTIAVLAWHFGRSSESHLDSGGSGLLFESDVVTGTTHTLVASDASWKQTIHRGYLHDTGGSQPNGNLAEWNVSFDARNAGAMAGWTSTNYDDSAWTAPVLKGNAGVAPWNGLVQRPTPLYKFSGLKHYVNDASLPAAGTGADITATLPSNLQLTPYLQVDAPSGLVITIQTDHYAEGPNVRSTYVTTSGVQEFESLGWMSGGAVVYNIPTGVKVLGLRYRESGYDTGFAGSFASNDPFFDKLWTKAVRTMYVDMRDTFMDCPTRERAQWWGDSAIEIANSSYAFDTNVHALADKAIRELVDWQRSDGVLYSPIPGTATHELPSQSLASIVEFWDYYVQSGDASALDATTYLAAKNYLNLWTMDSQGLVAHRAGDADWWDWGGNVDVRVLENSWYYRAVGAAINLARLTGNDADVAAWQARKDSIAANFDPVLWDSTAQAYRSPGYTTDTDDRANAMAVVAGLAGADKYPALTQVLQVHQNANPYMETFVIQALYMMNAATLAQDRLVARYTTEVRDPGYTLWEFWSLGGTTNHAWNGAPLMLSRYGVGARPTSPGWSTYDLLPQLGKLTRMTATVPTVKGKLTLNLDADDPTSVSLHVVAPAGTVGRIGVPLLADGARIVVNGTTVFKKGKPTGSVAGLTYAGTDALYVYFQAAAGTWKFTTTGTARVVEPAPGWHYCAAEEGTCSFTGTAAVRFGAGTAFDTLTLANGSACNFAIFGDPAPGVLKHCEFYIDPNGPAGYAFCAKENARCAFTGAANVAYGIPGAFRYAALADGTNCDDTVFGDPAPGQSKSCYVRLPGSWSLCAPENGWCSFAGDEAVRYGIDGAYLYLTADGSTSCDNTAFDSDPAPGHAKHCDTAPLPPANGWTECGAEGSTCILLAPATVAFGNGDAFLYKEASASLSCMVAAFGGDPAEGQSKSCYYR